MLAGSVPVSMNSALSPPSVLAREWSIESGLWRLAHIADRRVADHANHGRFVGTLAADQDVLANRR